MSLAVLHLPRTPLLALCLGLAACSTAPAHLPPKPAAKAVPRKDYSARRIGGREELQLPGIGLIHADKREQILGGDVLFSGRVFLEIKTSDADLLLLGKAHYAYAEKARWNRETGVLRLEGLPVVEIDFVVFVAREAGALAFFDRSGKVTTQGWHETFLY